MYVRPIAGTGEQVQISADGGVEPVFGPDGRELFYGGGTAQATAMLMKAAFVTEPTFTVTSRAPLFSVAGIATATPHRTYDISPDGQALARAVGVVCMCHVSHFSSHATSARESLPVNLACAHARGRFSGGGVHHVAVAACHRPWKTAVGAARRASARSDPAGRIITARGTSALAFGGRPALAVASWGVFR